MRVSAGQGKSSRAQCRAGAGAAGGQSWGCGRCGKSGGAALYGLTGGPGNLCIASLGGRGGCEKSFLVLKERVAEQGGAAPEAWYKTQAQGRQGRARAP